MKLIVESDSNGNFYIFRETEKQNKKMKKERTHLKKIELKDLPSDNYLNMFMPGSYIEVDIKK